MFETWIHTLWAIPNYRVRRNLGNLVVRKHSVPLLSKCGWKSVNVQLVFQAHFQKTTANNLGLFRTGFDFRHMELELFFCPMFFFGEWMRIFWCRRCRVFPVGVGATQCDLATCQGSLMDPCDCDSDSDACHWCFLTDLWRGMEISNGRYFT